jgi:ATP-dependent DNA ligase
VALYDEKLRSRFDWRREPDADAVGTPPVLMTFDLLYQDGREFTRRPLRERRARLEEVVAGSEFVLPVRRLAKNGFGAWSEVIAQDYEGYVAKDETSLYEAGRRGGPLAATDQCSRRAMTLLTDLEQFATTAPTAR